MTIASTSTYTTARIPDIASAEDGRRTFVGRSMCDGVVAYLRRIITVVIHCIALIFIGRVLALLRAGVEA